jgi:UDP-glucose 4-epimerase
VVSFVVLTSGDDVKTSLVTGATGFIGRRLVAALQQRGANVRVLVRDMAKVSQLWQDSVAGYYGDMVKPETLTGTCEDVDTVFHLAGYAHAIGIPASEAKELHQRITVEGTRALLAAASRAGVKRFIYLSSVKAMGEGDAACLDESSPAAPETYYGSARLTAERLVLAAGSEHGLHVCNLRLPLVYGRDNNGNLARMIAAIDRGWFPPLPEVNNKRSMVHVDDVVQAMLLAASMPAARGQTYLVTDDRIYSTRQIYMWICAALNRPIPGWMIPLGLLKLGARLGDLIESLRGRPFVLNSDALEKLLDSAWYNSAKIRRELGFQSRQNLETALPEMVAEYRRRLPRTGAG